VVVLETIEDSLTDLLDADPDIVVVGAVRDRQAATVALEAALDGVLVLIGVPAPDEHCARARLAAMGVEPFLLEHAVTCAVAVRPDAPGHS
jgi:type II secretory ATPase GspE/PulE/Tfp pilus assembly ATPase PilB-like protein